MSALPANSPEMKLIKESAHLKEVFARLQKLNYREMNALGVVLGRQLDTGCNNVIISLLELADTVSPMGRIPTGQLIRDDASERRT